MGWVFITLVGIGLATGFTWGADLMFFQKNKPEDALERAIENDDAAGIATAIATGANVNSLGEHGVTPLILAVGKGKRQAVAELLRHKANTDLRSQDGETAVTLAATAYKKHPHLLDMLLKAGANPNTLFSDRNPIMVRFLNDHNLDAVRYLHAAGANLDLRSRSNDPLVFVEAIKQDWDAVDLLLSLGAKYDYKDAPITWMEIFGNRFPTPPDSPLWKYKVKAWRFLKQNGQFVPRNIEDLVAESYWVHLKEKGLPKPVLE